MNFRVVTSLFFLTISLGQRHGAVLGGPCDNIIWTAPDPGFTDSDFQAMYELFRNNLNYEGCGAVIDALPPEDPGPGGSYIYHWMRSGGEKL